MNKNWYTITAQAEKKAEILIYEQIGEDYFGDGVSAKGFATDLKALGDLDEITVRINSPGGNVFDGNAIFNILRAHKATIIVAIDGIAASIASVIAMAGDRIVMPENAMMMIHDPSGLAMGTAQELRTMADTLDKVKISLLAAYKTKVNIEEPQIIDMMTNETWLSAADAVEMGFADEIAEPVRIAANFDLSMFKHAPKNLTGGNKSASFKAGEAGITNRLENKIMTGKTATPEHDEQCREEGRNEIRATIPNLEAAAEKLGESKGLVLGAKNEHARCTAVKAALIPGHEKLIAEMVDDGKTTGLEALQRVVAAENAARTGQLDNLKSDAEGMAVINNAAPSNVIEIDANLPLADRCEAEWKASPDLRAEFGEDFDRYLAYMESENEGLNRQLNK